MEERDYIAKQIEALQSATTATEITDWFQMATKEEWEGRNGSR